MFEGPEREMAYKGFRSNLDESGNAVIAAPVKVLSLNGI
jgi:hypothetical protein